MYEFAWETPAFDGKLKACHSVEVPFVFDTLGVIGERHHKPGDQALADTVSRTWAAFARTGKADWAPYTNDKRTTMIFDDESRTVDDPDKDVRPIWTKVATA
jgi:para-nitrobenzyl esterase